MGRLPSDESPDTISELIHPLHRAGWSIGDTLVSRDDGSHAWTSTRAFYSDAIETYGARKPRTADA